MPASRASSRSLAATLSAALSLAAAPAIGQPQALAVPADSARWQLDGKAVPAEYLGRKCLLLDGGAATVKDFEMRDGVVDVDVATPATRGFFGIQFRIAHDGANAEWVYLRQHKSGAPDALQYTPVLNTGLNWQLYNGPGFTGAVDIPKDVWFHVRLEVTGAQAKLFVKDMEKPVLAMDDLKSGLQKGEVALAALTGATYFSNFEVRTTPDAHWERHLPRTPPGLVAVNRYRESPHPRVSFASDFSKRLEPQPGIKVVYARTVIESGSDQVTKLLVGYSDDVSVFLNGRILFRGRSAQNFRDPGFLGIVNPENDAVYLPLKKGPNELILAVSELGGGWGFICRLEDPEP